MPDSNIIPGFPACEECGYSLKGLREAEASVCPECGAAFDPAKPWVPEPWATKRRLFRALCLPTAILIGFVVVASVVPGLREWIVWTFWPGWVLLICAAAFILPFDGASTFTARSEAHATRKRALRRTVVQAIVVNVTIATIGLAAAWALLSMR